MRKIYAFCDTKHKLEEEYHVPNHIIAAIDEASPFKIMASWVSSNHSYGKEDIRRAIEKVIGNEPYELEWVDNLDTHPFTANLFEDMSD